MFWALFDKIDLEDFDTKEATFEITEETGKILFAFYSICAVMVALNMLIAMMTTSYDKITVRKKSLSADDIVIALSVLSKRFLPVHFLSKLKLNELTLLF